MKIIGSTLEEKIMLQDVIENIKDVPAFLEKKEAIRNCIDPEKSNQGILRVSLV